MVILVMVHGIRDQFFLFQGKKPVLLDNRQMAKLQFVLTSKYPYFEEICDGQVVRLDPNFVRDEFPPHFVVNVVMVSTRMAKDFSSFYLEHQLYLLTTILSTPVKPKG